MTRSTKSFAQTQFVCNFANLITQQQADIRKLNSAVDKRILQSLDLLIKSLLELIITNSIEMFVSFEFIYYV